MMEPFAHWRDAATARPHDEHFMELALRLGRRTMGATGPNPAVGCIIVDEGVDPPRILARGWTGVGGRPHAEQIALDQAGTAASGATAYVTLEPCAHYGKTPPCAKALADAGIARVVTTCVDPDPRVSGRGHATLHKAGIEVMTGVLAEEARRDLVGFLTRITLGRPHVVLKLAVSADGKIAVRPGVRTMITGELVQARVHLMRAESDVVLVGRNTVVIDDPALTCRLPGLGGRSPVRAVMASTGGLPAGCQLVRTARDVPTWLFCAAEPKPEEAERLSCAGVETIACGYGERGRVALLPALRAMAGRGTGRLMVEGGAGIASAFLHEDLVDEVALFRSPRPLGAQGVDAVAGARLSLITDSDRFAPAEEESFGEDRLTLYLRKER